MSSEQSQIQESLSRRANATSQTANLMHVQAITPKQVSNPLVVTPV
ncbi:uncharacterized protein METZ01_LOCUS39391 [marine metagenome]|uniref:Uncharacterized protein n=1 Tax=marine metagenome TaxID=408172 RepID=A0A381R9L1_9ZZZZ